MEQAAGHFSNREAKLTQGQVSEKKTKEEQISKIILELLNPTWWSMSCYQGLMGLFSDASNDLFC